ncbi:hypothetical protein D4764_11G0008300 [Takifugu flavidus]|uniref:Uncharacterized protein n=1 Tax=Takifugu flavidus TaxID=433684 RepID=A0A5C6PIL6_9TELE|nr:hypothetical protein D4764_11G0008300 [Takifugu flavidus]
MLRHSIVRLSRAGTEIRECLYYLYAEVPAESLTYRTDSPSSQQNRPLPPVLSDIPVLTGVEENIEAGEQDDKEELEFPHDLLPSLDFSSELNIWESSLGAEISSEEEKHEQVNPLLAGLQHHMEVCQPLVVLDTRPYDCNPVHTDPEPSPWPNITSPHPVTQPLSRPPSKELDRELQEAFQECEEQMASLGILGVTETLATTSEDVEGLWGKTGEDPVNRTESSSLARGEVQPAQSSEGHGNAGTHGRSYPANSQKDTDGFSFRNYILGISSKVKGSDAEMQDAVVTNRAVRPPQKDHRPPLDSQHTPKESCSSKMPHNVVEAETKGQRNICTTDIEISSPEGQAGGKEALFLEAVSSTTPCGLLTGPDCLDHSVVSLEAAEEGGEGDMKHKGGLASEHIIFSQPEGSVGGVSSAETEMCPPTDVAESLLKPQYWSEQIPTITESLCIEKDHSSQCWQEQQNAADLPPSAPSERSSSRTNGELRTEGNRNVISVEAQPSVDGTCEESSITQEEKTRIHVIPLPQTTSARTSIKQESNDIQQVAPECGTFEARTAKASSEYQVPVHKGKQAMSSVGLHVCDYSGSKNKMHFEDVKNLPVLATDFDSLPPLTVRESLQHPVVETSYIFQDFLNNNKAEISTSVADRKDEPPSQRPPGGEPGIKDLRINLNDDNSNLKKNTLDSKSMDETHSELLQCTSNKNQNDEEYLALTQNAICEPDHLKVQPLPDNVLNLLGAEEESDKLPVESELPLSLPAEVQQLKLQLPPTQTLSLPPNWMDQHFVDVTPQIP